MRLGQLFSNFGNKIKNFGLRVGSTLSKAAPKVLKVGSFVSGVLSHAPGLLGTAANYVHKGIDAANRVISSLPNSSFKEKLQDLSHKANDATNTTVNKLSPAVRTAQVIGDTSNKILDAIKPKII